ncbi:MAG: hypothetical protein LBV04_00760 [Deferribacteraceae bacterium]|jgi:flagellar motor switch protein FliG|nr:hypothetical protein [Deferribacteraceae bacterium]
MIEQLRKLFQPKTKISTVQAALLPHEKDCIARINAADPQILCTIMLNERSSIQALFLHLIEPKLAIAIMKLFPDSFAQDLTNRLQHMERIHPKAINIILTAVCRKLDGYDQNGIKAEPSQELNLLLAKEKYNG